MGRYNYDKNYFDNIDSPEKAYWFGFLCADGCITRFYKNEELRSMSVELTLKDSDTGHLQKYINALNANVPIQHRTVTLKSTGKEYYADRVVINNTHMCWSLINHGCTPRKSTTLEFPSENDVPREYISHFMRGYFDGDGHFHQSQYNKYTSTLWSLMGTESFLNDYRQILIDNGIPVSGEAKPESRGENISELRIHGLENIRSVFEFLYSGSTEQTRLDRKYERYLAANFVPRRTESSAS